jgi:hypothetical protein
LKASWGVAKLVKAPDFDSGMRRFESFLPSPELCIAVEFAYVFQEALAEKYVKALAIRLFGLSSAAFLFHICS